MCGRYSSTKDIEDLINEFEVQQVGAEKLYPDYNVAPTKQVPAILARVPKASESSSAAGASGEAGGTTGDGDAVVDAAGPERHLRMLRWGLVPFWSKDIKIGNRMINARLETAAEKPAYRKAFRSRRCLLPADGYYEWYTPEAGESGESAGTDGTTKPKQPKKQPFFIRPADGGTLAMAGLYEIWRDPDKAEDDPDRFVWTCTILTTSAEDAVGRIHDRAPLTLDPSSYATWLDPRVTDVDEIRGLLVPATPGRLEAYPVSTAVNNVRNNGPSLVEPVPFDA